MSRHVGGPTKNGAHLRTRMSSLYSHIICMVVTAGHSRHYPFIRNNKRAQYRRQRFHRPRQHRTSAAWVVIAMSLSQLKAAVDAANVALDEAQSALDQELRRIIATWRTNARNLRLRREAEAAEAERLHEAERRRRRDERDEAERRRRETLRASRQNNPFLENMAEQMAGLGINDVTRGPDGSPIFRSTYAPSIGAVGLGWSPGPDGRLDQYTTRRGNTYNTNAPPPEACFNCGGAHWRLHCPRAAHAH